MTSEPNTNRNGGFTPALGHAALTPFYDAAIALMTRERVWRDAFIDQIAPKPGDVIVDVGCGTGTLALMLKRRAPDAHIVGLDPDAAVLARARDKAARARLEVRFEQGLAHEAMRFADLNVNKIVSSLVFHQTPIAEKRAGLAAMCTVLTRGGEVHIADYGLQRTRLMRALFRQIQQLDGYANTTPNAQGVLPSLMHEAGFANVRETRVVPTPSGSISLYAGVNRR